ncbi:type I-C CRISPR-associated protein Cas8c/Csd1 [Tibeticola sp.]|uniref:type I-C CRISPR-associated protein Cas8c/Csd1 n=1 Tax=Tibeticola sp. TaxID=2005368 RepID=UPI0025CC2FA7|nr:type I-C CRISPR-associated protein Cas8c/Csd1 [Tibeticola sp.]
MILQALDAYYHRKEADPDAAQRLPPDGFEEKEIPFLLELDADGTVFNIVDTREGADKKKAARRFLVPQAVKKTSGVAANAFWDNAEYVLGLPDPKKLGDSQMKGTEAEYRTRLAEMRTAFRQRIASLSISHDVGVAAILAFLDAIDLSTLARFSPFADIEASNPLLSFRLRGDVELVCQRPAVVAALAAQQPGEPDGICLVTGQKAQIERLHPAIKGVWGAQTSGANIVSFNLDAFRSYGKEQGTNAPVGRAAAFAYTTALNHLLAKGSRQRMQVGDASTVFWAEAPHELEDTMVDLFGEPTKDDPDKSVDAVRALYAAVETGRFSVGQPDTRFHVLGLAPNAARISIRFWETATAHVLAGRIKRHFDDLEIGHASYEPRYLSLFRLLTSVAVLNKADNIPPNLGGDVMRAILEGLPYPRTLLNLAVTRCRAEQQVTYARAAALKASLNRWIRFRQSPEKEFLPMLDPANTNPGYLLGRLFATLERIQEDAAGGPGKLNATIRDRYYGAASSTPAAVFSTLLRLSKHHLGKLATGLAISRERLIGEIMDRFEADSFPPRVLPLAEQARFALGYYHQRQAFFTKSEPKHEEESQ